MPPIAREFIDPDADKVVRRLRRYGFTAYLVGGCVRDLLLGRSPKDFDVATSATPQEIKSVFRNCRVIGRRFRLAHIFFGQKIIETSTFRANPREGADPEDDAADMLIRRDNVFGTAEEDARRRDFTINGLFYDVEKEEVIDHVHGLADLEARLVRTIGDPETRFPEDPVRILRAIKFAARLNFDIEPDTYEALLNHEHEIHQCAAPRVLEEIYRLLRGGAARRSMELLLETGVATTLAPELVAMFQGPPWLEGAAEGSGEDPLAGARPRAWRVLDELDGLAARTAPPLTRRREGRVYVEPGRKEQPPPPSAPPTPEVALAELSGRTDLDDLERAALELAAAGERPVVYPPAPPEEPLAPRADSQPPVPVAERARGEESTVGGSNDETFWTSPPTNALLLTALVAPFVPDVHSDRPGELFAAVDDALNPLATRMRVSRRDFERARQILLLQKRLAPSRRRRGRPMQLTRREYFGEALALYELLSRAGGELGDEVTRWRQLWRRSSAAVGAGEGLAGAADEDQNDGERVPHARPLPDEGGGGASEGGSSDGGLPGDLGGDGGKRRRRRRRGGRRRQKGGVAGGTEIDALVAVAGGLPEGGGGNDEA